MSSAFISEERGLIYSKRGKDQYIFTEGTISIWKFRGPRRRLHILKAYKKGIAIAKTITSIRKNLLSVEYNPIWIMAHYLEEAARLLSAIRYTHEQILAIEADYSLLHRNICIIKVTRFSYI